ncbi:MAG: prepilin peptidase [Alteraurantiacibacter sp.]
MFNDPITYGLLAALAIALLVAAYTDIKSRRIANWLNGAIALGAPVFWIASGYAFWPDIAIQLGLAVAVFALGSVLFALKQMGGGDVKLLTALALWMQPLVLVKFIIMMALIGGVLTLVIGARNVMGRRKKPWAVPYGVAISAAGLWVIGTFFLPVSAIAAAAQ